MITPAASDISPYQRIDETKSELAIFQDISPASLLTSPRNGSKELSPLHPLLSIHPAFSISKRRGLR